MVLPCLGLWSCGGASIDLALAVDEIACRRCSIEALTHIEVVVDYPLQGRWESACLPWEELLSSPPRSLCDLLQAPWQECGLALEVGATVNVEIRGWAGGGCGGSWESLLFFGFESLPEAFSGRYEVVLDCL